MEPQVDRSGATSRKSAGSPPLRVFVLARPRFDQEEALSFLRSEDETWRRDARATDAEKAVEFAGRICYMSFGTRQSPRSTPEYIKNLIDLGHESVLEHVAWTFLLTGVSRSFTHQLVRHRVGFSYSQLSQQYHDETDATAVVPSVIRDDEGLSRLWEEAVEESRDAYRKFMEELERREELSASHDAKERLRLIRSAARGVLPGNTETKIVVTANARALRHFLTVRGGLTGDEEMRRVSVALLDILQADAPSIFQDFQTEAALDGRLLVRARGLTAD